MIDLDLARALRRAGLAWRPVSGDRFVIDMPDLEDQAFVLSDLTVDVHEFGGQSVLGFNGTVEWALDSVTLEQALWLPHEHQLREALGSAFRQLTRREDGQVVVSFERGGAVAEVDDDEVDAAYGRALLILLTS